MYYEEFVFGTSFWINQTHKCKYDRKYTVFAFAQHWSICTWDLKISLGVKTNQSELNSAKKKATLAKLVCLTGLSYCVVQPLTRPAISTVNFPSFSLGGNSCLLQLQLESDVLVFSSQACEVLNSSGSCLLMSIYCFAGHGYHFYRVRFKAEWFSSHCFTEAFREVFVDWWYTLGFLTAVLACLALSPISFSFSLFWVV